MSLATRCSACGTVFRVVQDQLKVSEGWVRCGRCNEVFNALSGLFDLDRESPPEWEPQQRDAWSQPAPAPHESTNDADDAPEAAPPSDPRLVDRIDEELFGTRASAPDSPGDDANAAPQAAFVPEKAPAGNALPSDEVDDADEQDAPEFVRHAERAQRWKQPWVRAVLGLLATTLLVVLGLQFAHHFRDELAARHPETAPALSAWCEIAGCRIGPPRRIDDVAVESTTLSKAGGVDAYRLGIVLRNHGTTPVAMPSIDLALTDASGQLIARRNLESRDFAAAPDRLSAGGEASLQAVLTAGATKITGYTVELFYP